MPGAAAAVGRDRGGSPLIGRLLVKERAVLPSDGMIV